MAAQCLPNAQRTVQPRGAVATDSRHGHHGVHGYPSYACPLLPTATSSHQRASSVTMQLPKAGLIRANAQLVAADVAGAVVWQERPNRNVRHSDAGFDDPSSHYQSQLNGLGPSRHASHLAVGNSQSTCVERQPFRSPDQQCLPPSPPSSSTPIQSSTRPSNRSRSHAPAAATAAPPHASGSSRRRDALLTKIAAARNWYELRAILITSTFGAASGDTSDPSFIIAVLQRLVALTQHRMLPPECADLRSFLGSWLLGHTSGLPCMGPCELSLCMHSLAKLRHAMPAPPPAWAAAWFAAAQPYLLQCAFRPKDLSLCLWALSRMQLRLPPAAMQLLLAAAEPLLGRFNGQDMAMVALALSTLQARYDGAAAAAVKPTAAWRHRFLARCEEVLPECGSQALANMLHGVVWSGMQPSGRLLGGVCAALYGRLPECTPQALANVLSALAACGYVPEAAWVRRFMAESAARMEGRGASGGFGAGANGVELDGSGGGGSRGAVTPWRKGCFNAEDLTHLAAAAAQLALVPPPWWMVRLYGAMETWIPVATPRQLAQMLQAGAQLRRSVAAAARAAARDREAAQRQGRSNSAAADERGSALAARGKQATKPLEAANSNGAAAVDALSQAADAARPPRSLIAAWHHAAAAALPHFNNVDVAHSLWALATLGERPPRTWVQALLVLSRSRLATTAPAELALLLWSLAALRCKPTWSWLADALEASIPAMESMGGQDFAMLTSAAARLGARPDAAWSAAALAALRRKLAVLETRALADTARGLYRLKVQPEPEWLEAVAAELRCRWQRLQGEASGAGVRLGSPGELRSAVLLLWVVSKWLGEQKRMRPAARQTAGGDTQRLQRLRQQRTATSGAVISASQELPSTAGTSTAAAAAADAMSGRARRRRRARRPGNLVASLNGYVDAAVAFRSRIADSLLGPVMDATQPLLASGRASPLDAVLLAAVMAAQRESAGLAAAPRPGWVPALLAATAPHLRALSPHGLQLLLGGLHALGAEVDAGWVVACARAVVRHLQGPLLAAVKVALLRRLCSLRLVGEDPLRGDDSVSGEGGRRHRLPEQALRQQPASAPASEEGGGRNVGCGVAEKQRQQLQQRLRCQVLAAGLAAMRRASRASAPLLQLHLELLKAKVRLRKLRVRISVANDRRSASLDPSRLATSAALLAETAAAALGPAAGAAAYDVKRLRAAASKIRCALFWAVRRSPQSRVGERLPAISGDQRAWIRQRAQRVTAAVLAESSPVLIVQLVSLTAYNMAPGHQVRQRLVRNGGVTSGKPLLDGSEPGSCMAAAGAAAVPAGGLLSQPGGHASLLWLADATNRCSRFMLWTHRARVALAWRRILQLLPAQGPRGQSVRADVAARLPQLTRRVRKVGHARSA